MNMREEVQRKLSPFPPSIDKLLNQIDIALKGLEVFDKEMKLHHEVDYVARLAAMRKRLSELENKNKDRLWNYFPKRKDLEEHKLMGERFVVKLSLITMRKLDIADFKAKHPKIYDKFVYRTEVRRTHFSATN